MTRALVDGEARGEVLVLEEPLSFWGGMDPETGLLIDRRHPQAGATLSGRVLAMPWGRGSSSSSNVLAEAIRLGTAPAAILLGAPDPIVALGAIVANELYGRALPVIVLDAADYGTIRTGHRVRIRAAGGSVEITPEPARPDADRSGGRT